MADGDNIPFDVYGYLANASQPNIPASQNAPMPPPPDVGQDQQQAPPPSMQGTPPPPQQQQPPQMGSMPLIARYLTDVIRGPQTGVGPDGQPIRPVSRGDMTLNFLGEFLGNMAAGFQQSGHGPGANLRGAGAAMMAPYQRALQGYELGQQQQAQQAQIQAEQARTALTEEQTRQMGQMVTLPNGMTVNYNLAKTLYPQLIRTQGSERNVNVRTQAQKDIAGQKIESQEKQTGEKLAQAQKSLDEKVSEFKQTDQYRTWKAKLDNDTKLKVAEMTAGKAPAAMLQTASFASGALDMMADAQSAMQRLEAKGTMGSIPSNKIEDLVFGKGLVDPTLDAETRGDIGRLRAALGYTSSAAMRAHTGRTSKEIYEDFKNRLGPGQDWSALRGAMDETQNLMTHYATAASNVNIQQLRQGNIPQAKQQQQAKPKKDPLGIF